MTKLTRVYALGLAAALVLVAAPAGAASARAVARPHVIPIDPAAVDDPAALLKLYAPGTPLADDPTATARCGDPAADPVPDGQPIVVTIPPAGPFTVGAIPATSWRSPPVADPSWRLNFQGLMWMKPLARRAAMDGQSQSLAALVAQAVAFHAQNPDPKNDNYGWDEGTSLRRLETENCLFSLTGSATLAAGMTAEAAVLLGSRYYGPPGKAVHNHGLMANLQLVRAATLLNRTTWKDTAIRRMIYEAPLSFSKVGTSFEQSSMYQQTNASLWDQAAHLLATTPGSEAAGATIGRTVAAAYKMFTWLTEPDGRIVQVGDAEEMPGRPADLGANRVFRDDQAGWLIGRWAWTNPGTPYYTIRYGPARRAHGHHDRAGGVTWSIKGLRVLVGTGLFTYDPASNYLAYQRNPQGQNVAIPDKGTAGGGTSVITRATYRAATHKYTLQDTVYGRTHVRGVTVDRDLPRIAVSDAFGKTSVWRQSWHLDPKWTLISSTSTKLVFSHPSGHRLTVGTTGRVSSVRRGVTRPPQGWHFPAFGSRVQAAEITVRNYGAACTTTFWVS
jgi:hypothetical protein